jgi:sugar O-acyltransferase (sialic acid O-acetyltransferase NeuD family)
MSKLPIILFGASGHAKVIIDIIEKANQYEIIGLLDNHKSVNETVCGYAILGDENILPALLQQYKDLHCIISIGDNWKRYHIYEKLKQQFPVLQFGVAIHPHAKIGKQVIIDEGTVIMAGVIINPDVQIGKCVILNTNSSIDHDCILGDYCSLAPGAILGGKVTVNSYSAISIGAIIKHGISIGKHCVIGAGALVLKDVEDYHVVYGTPAKLIRKRSEGEPYL